MIDATRNAGRFDVPERPDAWDAFTASLVSVLAGLRDGQFLILAVPGSRRCVQFAIQTANACRAEVVSNYYLPPHDRLDDDMIAWLASEGWRPPTGTPEASTPDDDPDGSPNHFVDLSAPVDHLGLVCLAARTLRRLGVTGPSQLTYRAFDEQGTELEFAGLGLDREPAGDGANGPSLEERLLGAVRAATRIPDLEPDSDGDLPVRYGTMVAFVRVERDPDQVRCVSPLATDLRIDRALLEDLNELNTRYRGVRFVARDDTVWGIAEMPAEPFVAAHVAALLLAFCVGCDGVGPWLARKYGGQPFPRSEAIVPTLQ